VSPSPHHRKHEGDRFSAETTINAAAFFPNPERKGDERKREKGLSQRNYPIRCEGYQGSNLTKEREKNP